MTPKKLNETYTYRYKNQPYLKFGASYPARKGKHMQLVQDFGQNTQNTVLLTF